ncbi:FAD-dependent oxidoreductase [Clostridium cylindrosporum]|uniref:Glucose inhibited division protein A n=1 Tax=Clostridium cylindrosporum DSM 605 TaxID=1121307 RepID=A0A0J8G0Q5_CLOCY|nr:FAD-dependent oxidoreductase [Clostridium cylindrosporum]KMT21376.1 glucose inhibited division protein A [Clostridium cylindrosporum DSM 605]
MKVIVIGGGWSGCAAALQAKKSGADVVLIEKTDLLLGLGNVGGIIRNNGRYTATEEMIGLGAGELFHVMDNCARHKDIEFPGHKHATLYDVCRVEPEVRKYLLDAGIEILFQSRVSEVEMDDKSIKGIYLHDGTFVDGDVFVETTGSTGPMGNCVRYGNGCSMCILRCPSFGPRISISKRAGVEDILGMRGDDSYGAMSGSCKLNKDSLSNDIRKKLDETGVVVIKVPEEDINLSKLSMKVCQQYALKEFAENIIILDTGHAKLMTSYYPIEKLRKIDGLENARYEDPYSGGIANSIRYLSMAPRDNTMKVRGIKNLFVGGEKAGLFVGHTEAIVTGTLAGYNAVRNGIGLNGVSLPRELSVGDIIAFENESKETIDGVRKRYTFAGSDYFKRMKENKLYTTNIQEVEERISSLMLKNMFKNKLV